MTASDPSDPRDPRDPLGLAADAPLLAAWLGFDEAVRSGAVTPFTIPGHKHRTDLVGDVIRGDVPFYGGLGTMKDADTVLADAERRAANAWGVDWCRLSVGGSTHANQAAVLALGRPDQSVVVSRTLHRSLLLAIVFAGLRPVWVRPEIDVTTGLPGAIPASAVRTALAANPDACGVVIGDPSYVGTMSDIEAIAAAAHEAGVPLVVDGAWAAYFGFSPRVPEHALARGADALVMSAHKTLPTWSQGALLVARTTRSGALLDPDRLERAFDASHTTSAAGAILASADASRALLEQHGIRLIDDLVALVARARDRLEGVAGIAVLRSSDELTVDPAKLVVHLSGTGAHGHAIERDLLAAGLPVEMADRDVIVPIITMADAAPAVDRLLHELIAAVERHRGEPRHPAVSPAWTVDAETALAPREAFFARHETVPVDATVGRVCAELVAPYPPGVPVLAPGEVVSATAIEALRQTLADGGRIAYAADPTLASIQVVAR
ncbi:aminotransferase class V-fold PLP-dependent enzyme [Microbacterium sp. 2FI]|uniref:aminotransferase class I/II-fold pyridoxal phosphate-dependent enzyme n=1 Tax=Microbacterium sp. 2FI TaxID=2502193 RepID=UPI0010F9E7FB|nr:aminotransferase class V-fold PLP-dependent enzyme [Microbacterium sp. 2FI]